MTYDDNTPITSADDPRLTAYALGELDDPTQRAAVEAFLRTNPEVRALVDDLAGLGASLEQELAAEPAAQLDDARRARVDAAVAGAEGSPGADDAGPAGVEPVRGRSRAAILRMWSAAAAAVLVAGFVWIQGLDHVRRETAEQELLTDLATRQETVAKADGPSQNPERLDGPSLSSELLKQLETLGYIGEGESVPRSPAGGRGIRAAKESLDQLRDAATARGHANTAPPSTPEDDRDDVISAADEVRTRRVNDAPVTAPENPASAILPGDLVGQGGAASGTRSMAKAKQGKRASPQRLQALGYLGNAPAAEAPARADRRREELDSISRRPTEPARGESYAGIQENPFVPVTGAVGSALSTFGVDVDSASYSNVRRFLNQGALPPADAVRLEELVNAFAYADAPPAAGAEHPFAVHVEVAAAPWAPRHRLLRVALKGREIDPAARPPSNLVFLLDVSGSMSDRNKLPLLVQSMKLLLEQLDERDTVAVVTYASGTRVALPPTSVAEAATIRACLDGLSAGGSTNASAGIQTAYDLASSVLRPEGNNRVLLATDGDFNVGITDLDELQRFIEEQARSGVFLSVLGFGQGNYRDDTAERLADHGNGQYSYIDSLAEAQRVLSRQVMGTLYTIAKDVKVQVEFNPGRIAAWRQLGYENRALAAADFRNDRKDAGEIGAGHSVVAYYELVPVGVEGVGGTADLRYHAEPTAPVASDSDELLTVNLRYKQPRGETGIELSRPVVDDERTLEGASDDFRFGAAVAAFGMALRLSEHRGEMTWEQIVELAKAARGDDPDGERAAFVNLVWTAKGLAGS